MATEKKCMIKRTCPQIVKDKSMLAFMRRVFPQCYEPVICSPADHVEYCRYLGKLRQDFLQLIKNDFPANAKASDFEMDKVIGMSAVGIVYLVKYVSEDFDDIFEEKSEEDKYYAMKVLDKNKLIKLRQINCAYQEKKTLCAIRFPFVIHMQYWYEDNIYLYFVLPFILGGDFYRVLSKTGKLKESYSKFYAAQILLGLEYLHACHLVYRDLKPENILVDKNGYLKITDFAFCKEIDKRTWTFCGTPEYIAPEIILGKGYGFGVDWWAFGVFLFELNAGFSPFQGKNILKTYEKILASMYKCPGHFSLDLKHLIPRLLEPDISRRYGNLRNGANDIKRHKWFKDIDWDAILHCRTPAPFVPRFESPNDTVNFDNFDDVSLEVPRCAEDCGCGCADSIF